MGSVVMNEEPLRPVQGDTTTSASSLCWQRSGCACSGCFLCLVSFLLSAVMSSKKKGGGSSTSLKKGGGSGGGSSGATPTRRFKRARSISISAELECPGSVTRSSFKGSCGSGYGLRSGNVAVVGRSHNVPPPPAALCYSQSYEEKYVDRYRPLMHSYTDPNFQQQYDMMECDGDDGGAEVMSYMQELPKECKLKVFSFLTPKERGVAAQVCCEWAALMPSSSLWTNVDLSIFPPCDTLHKTHTKCTRFCYNAYKQRLKHYISYLTSVKPVLKRFSFDFDIGDYDDGWLDMVKSLLKTARLQELEYARLNWKETPAKPMEYSESMTWSSSDYNELMHKNRHRQRIFVKLFDYFTASAPNVTQLILPFDWSVRSLQALSRLRNLHSLILEKYFVFQPLDQVSVDDLFRNCPNLRRLIMEVWTPSGVGLQLYSIRSANLTYLDISQCRGFYLEHVDLPLVETFKVSRHPWNGPLVCSDNVHIPCIWELLRHGAPNLKQINEHVLQPEWKDHEYKELETVLKSVCSCRKHKCGWGM